MKVKVLGYLKLISTLVPVILLIALLVAFVYFFYQMKTEFSPMITEISGVEKTVESDAKELKNMIVEDEKVIIEEIKNIEKILATIEHESTHDINLITKELSQYIDIIVSPSRKGSKRRNHSASKIFGKKMYLFKIMEYFIHGIVKSISVPFDNIEKSLIKLERKLMEPIENEISDIEQQVQNDLLKVQSEIDAIRYKIENLEKSILSDFYKSLEHGMKLISMITNLFLTILIIIIIYLINRFLNFIPKVFVDIKDSIRMIKNEKQDK